LQVKYKLCLTPNIEKQTLTKIAVKNMVYGEGTEFYGKTKSVFKCQTNPLDLFLSLLI
jgi:hypothetical protein